MRYLSYAVITSLALTILGCSRHSHQQKGEEILDEQYVHKYGVAVPQDFWESSGEDGTVVSTLANGVVVSRSYKGGALHGETTYSYPNSSQIQKKELYDQGRLVKIVQLYTEGTPANEIAFDTPQEGSNILSSWYFSGSPKSVEQFNDKSLISGQYFNPSSQQDGTVDNGAGTRLIRDDYGQLVATDTIQDGMMVLRETYHPNLSPKERIPFQNNCIHGTKKTFLPGGEPETIEDWSDGYQNGLSIAFFHGEKSSEVPYINGQKQGKEIRYRDGSEIVQEISWQNDQLHGPSTTYVGDSSKTEWFFQGSPTSESNYQFMTNRPMVR